MLRMARAAIGGMVLMLICTGCHKLRNDVLAEPYHTYRIFKLKIYAKGPDFKQRGKVTWKFDQFNRSRMVFLTPLNQIVFLLYVDGNEEAVLVSSRKQLYWRGDFSFLLDRMWGIGFQFSELRSLVHAGKIPQEKTTRYRLTVQVEKDPNGFSPSRIKIYRRGLLINLKIYSRAIKAGRINPVLNINKCRESSLEEILESFG